MKNVTVAAALIGLLLVAGCNTVRGAGKDAKSVGDAASNAVK